MQLNIDGRIIEFTISVDGVMSGNDPKMIALLKYCCEHDIQVLFSEKTLFTQFCINQKLEKVAPIKGLQDKWWIQGKGNKFEKWLWKLIIKNGYKPLNIK